MVLPTPVSAVLPANQSTTLIYTDTQGLPTQFFFPTAALTQTTAVTITPRLNQDILGISWAGHAFNLAASAVFTFSEPVSITIAYSDIDVRTVIDENELRLSWWDGTTWVDAVNTCTPRTTYNLDTAANTLETDVCHSGVYALFGSTYQVYLPIIHADCVGLFGCYR